MARIWVAIILLVGIYVNLFGLWLYRKPSEATKWTRFQRWVGQFEFSPETLGGFSYARLAVVSLFGLFLELLMIRWVSSEITIFAYFKNFVLVACYLGFGLGCYLSKRRINLLALCVPLIALALLCELPSVSLHDTVRQLADVIGAISQVDYWGVPSMPLNLQTLGGAYTGSLFVVFVFGVVALVFIPIGQLVGWLLENATDGIFGYTVNVLASLTGIVLFTLLCFEFQPPATWFVVAGGLAVYFLWPVPKVRWLALATFLFCVVLTSLPAAKDTMVFWSPYQKLTIQAGRDDAGKIVSWRVRTNSTFYQDTLNLSDSFVAAHPNYHADEIAPNDKLSDEAGHYNLPYRFYPHPSSVLVLGSGTGNDVAAAVRNGAGDVTGVEIDPVILQEGRKLHFEQPYSSPHVHAILNDARSYLQNSNQRFDVIVFAFLDSHTTSSYYSTIRIDNYVYTLEALRRAKTLLKPDGIMVIKFAVLNPWIAGRLYELAQTVFGNPPLQFQARRLMIVGSQQRIAQALKDPRLAAYVTTNGNVPLQSASLTTDDWPYFYQHEPGIPASVIIILSVLIVLCGILLGRTGTSVRSIRLHFFFLGAAFMLLEAHIVSQMALLFGTTWVVNSIVISGLLVLIVAANLIVHWRPTIGVTVAYLGIFASIIVTYIVPPEAFFLSSFWAKVFVSTAVLCLPVFFAGIVFIVSFAREGFRSDALGSNLFGALVGGMLESMSMWTGMRSILILVALFYALSWIVLLRQTSRVEESESVPDLGTARV